MSFTTFASDDSIISSDVSISPMWSGDNTILSNFVTSSTQESSTPGKFYLDVYNNTPGATGADVQFSIAYGHISGSGSAYFNQQIVDKTPTRDIYGQFRSLIYGDENTSFTFGTSTNTTRDIIVISVSRACFKESFNPGSFFLTLTNSGYSIGLVDDSSVTTTSTYIGSSHVYQLLSGSYNTSKIGRAHV